jgi:multicomponent Na+:H+ antiporter subunit E
VRGLAANAVLAVTWAALLGGVTLPRLAAGFVLGYLLLGSVERLTGRGRYTAKGPKMVAFVAYFLVELVRANLRVAYDVLTRAHRSTPGVLAIPLEAESELEITLLANLITLTPGSMSLEVSADRRILYIHEMFARDPEAVRREIKEGLERRLLEVLR